MCELNTKITIAQLLRLTIVSAKSKNYSPRRGYLSPGNSIVLGISATLSIIHQRHIHASNRPVYFRDLCAAYSALQQKSSLIIFQPTYANLLSSKITQHDKFHKTWKSHKNLFQPKIY